MRSRPASRSRHFPGGDQVAILPRPVSLERQPGVFTLDSSVRVVMHASDAESAAALLQERLRAGAGLELSLGRRLQAEGPGIIYLPSDDPSLPADGYELKVSPDRVEVRAHQSDGFFYGTQTLLQLLPPSIYGDLFQPGQAPPARPSLAVPRVLIRDYPRFAWRGMMLDCSRHFFPVEYVKKFIDRLAMHKMNLFHWHLSDDEGWRIEIRRYPRLTEIGAWRGPQEALPPSHGSGLQRYGGFYTQEQVKEIVAYAAARNVTIMPEIDLPAHSRAVVVAYPELVLDTDDRSEYASVQGVGGNVVDPGMETTFEWAEGVLTELAELFPGPFLHIGGDERPEGAWLQSPAALRRMKDEGLPDTDALQAYFTRRLGTIVERLGRRMVGWEEAIKGGSPARNAAIVSWTGTGPGIQATAMGVPVFMAPAQYLYLDMAFDPDPAEPGLRWAKTLSMEKVYSYNPESGLPGSEGLLGIIAPLWSETLISPERADYMAFPRAAAAAEVGWTPQNKRDWSEFNVRLHRDHLPRLDAAGVLYRIPVASAERPDEDTNLVPGETADQPRTKSAVIHPPFEGADVRYTTDGTDPGPDSPAAEPLISLAVGDALKFRVIMPNGRMGRVVTTCAPFTPGAWTVGDLSAEGYRREWDVTRAVRRPGMYRVSLVPAGPNERPTLVDMALLRDGVVVARAESTNLAGAEGILRLEATDFSPEPVCRLRLKITGSPESAGKVRLAVLPLYLKTAVETSFEGWEDNHVPAHAADWDIGTYFRSNRAGRAGDTITVRFEEPQSGSVVIATGTHDAVHEVLPLGMVEISEDGRHFQELEPVATAEASLPLPHGLAVRAVRLRVLQEMRTRLSVRELHVQQPGEPR